MKNRLVEVTTSCISLNAFGSYLSALYELGTKRKGIEKSVHYHLKQGFWRLHAVVTRIYSI